MDGLRARRRVGASSDRGDGDDLGIDDPPDPGPARAPGSRAGHLRGYGSTSDYWKPFYYLLEDLFGVEVMLVNARHVKNLPGRKTDVADATWLAHLGAHGLVRGSFVPPAPIRQLRDLTRTRTAVTRARGREVQRLEKVLEDAGIKLSSVASDITGVSGRQMLEHVHIRPLYRLGATHAGSHGRAGRRGDFPTACGETRQGHRRCTSRPRARAVEPSNVER
jgi:transposase